MEKHPTMSVNVQKDDEIDLFQLWLNIKKQKKAFLVVFFGILVFGISFAFLSPQVYKTSVKILPPESNALSQLVIPHVSPVSPHFVYQEFADTLFLTDIYLSLANSNNFRSYFYTTEATSDFDVLSKFEKSLKISLPIQGKEKNLLQDPKVIELSFEADSPEMSFQGIISLLEISNMETKKRIKQNLIIGLQKRIGNNDVLFLAEEKNLTKEFDAEIERLIEQDEVSKAIIYEQMNSLKEKAKRDRYNRIEQLEEAYSVAKKLGIHKPITPVDYQARKTSGNNITLETKSPVGYWLGTKILSAEIQTLKNRKSDDAFIGELSGLKEQLKRLEVNERIEALMKRKSNLAFSDRLRSFQKENRDLNRAIEDIKKADFETFQFMLNPVIPSSPVKPNKLLIILVSAFLGLFLGLIVAVIRGAYCNRKKEAQLLALEQK